MEEKPLVLIIDDLKSNRMIIKKVLKNDYYFMEAADGIEAMNILNSYIPDIILIDAIMPNMDGFETIKKIRKLKKYQRTPILMITSLSNQKMKIKAIEYGVNDFLTKPFDKYELRARCKAYIEMVKINKLYENTKINPISRFKNEIALLNEIVPNDMIFLFAINSFNKIDGIYGYNISKILERRFGLSLKEIAFEIFGNNTTLYHVNKGKFVIKLDKDYNIAENKLEQICQIFYEKISYAKLKIENIQFSPTATIVYAHDRVNLYEDAMSALSYAKRNNIKYIFTSDDINGIKNIVNTNLDILKKLKYAIDTNNIVNHYQPILNNQDEQITNYETLVRLQCQNGELLSPFVFLEIAKNAQLYEQITQIVYQNAFDKFKYNNANFSINISYLDIENKVVREFLFNILKNNPHVSSRVIFEITEDKLIKNHYLTREFIQEIKKYEAKIAIDNYGSQNSSIETILSFEPNYIKIDGNIVKNMLNNNKNYILVEHLSKLAKSLGIKTIAQHVNSKYIYNEILDLGIDYSQGYFIGKPSSTLQNKFIFSTS